MSETYGRATPRELIAISVTGLATGLLTGMSASPVLAGVLASILTLVGALVSAAGGFSGSRETPPERTPAVPLAFDPLPVAVLAVFIVAGSAIGVVARVNEWLGPSPRQTAARWQRAGLALSYDRIVARLFEREMALPGSSGANRPDKPFLFDSDETLCNAIVPLEGDELRHELEHSGVSKLNDISKAVPDSKTLKAVARVLACGK